jgi:CspA family cold shock protein
VKRSLKGTVKRWLMGRGYGFIEPEQGDGDVFVHHSEIEGSFELREGQKVEFEVQDTYKGPRAINVKIVE